MALFRLIRSQTIVLTVSIALLVQLFNLSIDPADLSFEKEDLTKNEIESIVELVTEHLLDHENLIEETDDGGQHSLRCEMQIILFSSIPCIALSNILSEIVRPLNTEYQFFFELIPKIILTPPPRA
jgi:hypothetical protein